MHSDPCSCEQLGTCQPEHHDCDWTAEWWERRHVNMSPCLVDLPCTFERWPPLFALIKTLIQSPSLTQLVHHLRLAGPVPRSIWTNPQHTSLGNDERRHIASVLPCGSQMSKAGWLRRLDNGCPHAFAALLLVCVPKLRSLDLGTRFQDSLQILGPRTLAHILQELEIAIVGTVREKVWMGSGRAPFTHADNIPQLLLVHLPQIRSLSFNLPRPLAPCVWSDIMYDSFTTYLDRLELAFTFMDEYDLGRLLRVCLHLRTLKYDYWTTPSSRDPLGIHRVHYMPDRFSERLIETQVLQSSLDVVRETLVTLHVHIVKPWDICNQNLRAIDLSQFESLTELHAPLQLLVCKDSPRSLAASLPPSLRHLWLNDDATRLWLNHDYLMNPQDFEVEGEAYPADNPLWHPIYTDEEVVETISQFLSDWRAHVPKLEVLRMLFYHIYCPCWGQRNLPYLKNTLELAGSLAGIGTTVTKVHERPCYHQVGSVSVGQDPPYFTVESIEESQCLMPDLASPVQHMIL
jgi:hypothetical protein